MKKRNKIEIQEISLYEQLYRECLSMAKYAYTRGMKVPSAAAEIIENLEDTSPKAEGEGTKENLPGCKKNNPRNIKHLNYAHETLSKIVAPAKPASILFLYEEEQKEHFLKFLGAVPFVRRMTLIAIVMLVAFIAISLSPEINNKPETWDLFQSSGWSLLLKELFLISAAGLGASFTALFKANQFIVQGTFNPTHESIYWTRLILRIVAGMILATLIPIENAVDADFGKPLLAMLGGFSADIVYLVINRLMESAATLVRGDTSKLAEVKNLEQKTRLAEDELKTRFRMAADLTKLQQEIDGGSKPAELKDKIAKILNGLTEVGSRPPDSELS
jgi:hypothetical protein